MPCAGTCPSGRSPAGSSAAGLVPSTRDMGQPGRERAGQGCSGAAGAIPREILVTVIRRQVIQLSGIRRPWQAVQPGDLVIYGPERSGARACPCGPGRRWARTAEGMSAISCVRAHRYHLLFCVFKGYFLPGPWRPALPPDAPNPLSGREAPRSRPGEVPARPAIRGESFGASSFLPCRSGLGPELGRWMGMGGILLSLAGRPATVAWMAGAAG